MKKATVTIKGTGLPTAGHSNASTRCQLRQRPAISIILPMYNCERYVDDVLTSMARQTFDNLEVLCVDDGSTDSTRARILAFCQNDARFRCIAKEHGGAGSARNAGIEAAAGKYLLFLDADDLYSPELLAQMYAAAEKHGADLVLCQFEERDCTRGIQQSPGGFEAEVFPHDAPVDTQSVDNLYGQMTDYPCNLLSRKSLIDRYQLRFSDTQTYNDLFFVRAYASVTRTIVGLHRCMVVYRHGHNPHSVTSHKKERPEDALVALSELYDFLACHGLLERYAASWLRILCRCFQRGADHAGSREYAEAFADLLCKKEVAQEVENRMFYQRFWHFYDPQNVAKLLQRALNETPQRQRIAQRLARRLHTAAQVEKTAWERHHRVVNPYSLYLPAEKRETPVRVSVIVPVFNAEKTIGRCVDALLAQTLRELEFIFVDDASTDRSLEILRHYQEADGRVLVLCNEKNSGAGPARNRGIEAARGEYLSFVDADDRVSVDCYERLYFSALETRRDIIKGAVMAVDREGREFRTWGTRAFPNEARRKLAKGAPLFTVLEREHWSAIYARHLFRFPAVRYGRSYSGQDGEFLLQACLHANGAHFCDEVVYYYYRHASAGFLSDPRDYRHQMGKLASLAERIRILKEAGFPDGSDRYIGWYANYCLSRGEEYFRHHAGEAAAQAAYLAAFEKALAGMDDPARVYDALDSRYWKEKRVRLPKRDLGGADSAETEPMDEKGEG